MTAVAAPTHPIANWEMVRDEWVGRLQTLVDQVEAWGREFGWATRRIEKRMEDSQIGTYKAPALLLQAEFTRVLLEPVARFVPGASGAVDLYLMPAYDDIASLYDTPNGGWQLHYIWSGSPSVGDVRDANAVPLTKDALQRVLAEMKQHAQ